MNKNHSTQVSSLEAVRYPQYYLQSGIRKADSLPKPKFSALIDFEPPRGTIFHYITESSVRLGPPELNFMVRNHGGQTFVDHVFDLVDPIDTPKRLPGAPNDLRDKYHRSVGNKLRRIMKFETADSVNDALIIVNYAMINTLHEYRPRWNVKLSSFKNTFRRAILKANELAAKSERKQFFMVQTPEFVPTRHDLIKFTEKESKVTAKNFGNWDSLIIAEIWKFLGPNPESSLFSELSEKALSKTDIFFNDGINFVSLDLGLLNTWKDGHEGKVGLKPADLQYRFSNFLDTLSKVRILGQGDEDEESELDDLTGGNAGAEFDEDGNIIREEPPVSKVAPPADNKGTIQSDDMSVQSDVLQGANTMAREFLENGYISPKQFDRYGKLAESFKDNPDPFNTGLSIEEAMIYDDDDFFLKDLGALPEKDCVFDKSMLQSRLANWKSQYIEETYQKDILNVIMSLQNSNNVVTDIQVERQLDANNDIYWVTASVEAIGGGKSKVAFKVPKLKADGSYRSGGVNYFLRTQRGDIPIRKDKPWRVFCTSYASKLSITRSRRKKNSLDTWVRNAIDALDNDAQHPLKIVSSKRAHDPKFKMPRMFTVFAQSFSTIEVAGYRFEFNLDTLYNAFDENIINGAMENDEAVVGTDPNGKVVTINTNGYLSAGGESIGHIFEIMQVPDSLLAKRADSQVEAAYIKVLGTELPMVAVVSFNYGLERLLNTLEADYRRVPPGGSMKLQWDEYPVRFNDVTLVFKRNNHVVEMLMGPLWADRKIVSRFDLSEFNTNEVWSQYFLQKDLKPRYYREIDLLYNMWIDPITKRALKSINEPTEFRPLMMRAVEMMATDDFLSDAASKALRFKGNERIAGTVYGELYAAERQKRTKMPGPRHKLELNPHSVWMKIDTDPAKQIMEESNPIQNLKEMENTTFGGNGGKSGRTMVRRTREMDPDDIGTISEATVDSKDVAVTTFTTPDPNITSMLGFVDGPEMVELTESGKLISTSMLLSAFADSDDAKRVNFINIQQSHVVACKGYRTSPVRTGYEHAVGHRHVGTLFTMSAKADGVVTKVTKNRVEVKYDDPKLAKDIFEIDRKYGIVTGKVIPHDIVSDMSVGDRVFKGFIVAWNSGFYERDFYETGGVVWKQGIPIRVAYMDGPESIEDCTRMSTRLAGELEMNTTGVVEIDVSAEDHVRNLVRVGDQVEVDSDLCFIENAISGESGLFDDVDTATLRGMGNDRPKAKYLGKIAKIEVLYNGDLDDMTDSIREIVQEADALRAKRVKELKLDEAPTGQVPELQLDTVKIKVYIDSTNSAADGDKIVLNHQLKMVPGSIMVGKNTDEDGRDIDLIVAWQTPFDRIVNSTTYLGLLSMAVEKSTQKVLDVFDEIMST
tara:strand:- start:216251 stop:220384 length:4134 start_codon:yes stop_codon:yes gene_type:complete